VDGVQHRPAPRRIERRRVDQPHLHRIAARAGDLHHLVATQRQAGEQGVVEGLDAPGRLARQQRQDLGRVVERVQRQRHRAGRLVEAAHPAARVDPLGALVRQVEAPEVARSALLGTKQQRLAVVLPVQRGLDVVVPGGTLDLPAPAVALPHRELLRHGVLDALVAGDEGDALAAIDRRRAVAR